jgi:predicted nucleic acid-binding protein
MTSEGGTANDQPHWNTESRRFIAVIDTVGYLRALLTPYGPWRQILFDQDEKFTMLVAEPLLAELDDVLGRPALRPRLSTYPGRDLLALKGRLNSARFLDSLQIDPISRDPEDDYLIAMAVAGGASLLVT